MFSHLKFLVAISAQLVLLLSINACSPKLQTQPDSNLHHSRLTSKSAIMSDGYVLPMKTWSSTDEATAVVFAMHGFNDYSNAFDAAAQSFADNLITTYAIDQRGFGATKQHGIWAGYTTLQSDLLTIINLLCEKHDDLPLFLLGESMGGAVILSASQQLEQTCIQGVILSSPAVWGWQSMPWWQTVPLRMLAHMLPGLEVSGDGLEIHPSDNLEMLRTLGRDPMIIKQTRIDALYGLTNLMEAAMKNSGALRKPALILYGEQDEIIPPASFCEMLDKLPDITTSHWRLIIYPNGYHMLSRDLQGGIVIQDMVMWIHNQKSLLPSGQEIIQDTLHLSALSECHVDEKR